MLLLLFRIACVPVTVKKAAITPSVPVHEPTAGQAIQAAVTNGSGTWPTAGPDDVSSTLVSPFTYPARHVIVIIITFGQLVKPLKALTGASGGG